VSLLAYPITAFLVRALGHHLRVAFVPHIRAGVVQQVLCDRCQVALAKVEVITGAGSVFLCSHHHKMHRDAILAVGHRIRAAAAL
jgi:hypothetical protein